MEQRPTDFLHDSGEQPEKKHLVIGILAHVDAGKTTLSEGFLYLSGKIRKLGRVDHKDTYLDTDPIERERGITIFSKEARFETDSLDVTLLDTPGHVDFSAETERTLQVLDYAILLISGSEGVQSHTLTLWQLLRNYRIPTFLFVNKMDLPTGGEEALASELQKRLDPCCCPFFTGEDPAARAERLATFDDALFRVCLETGTVDDGSIAGLVGERRLFPVFFGSALRMQGVDTFLDAISRFSEIPVYPADFGGRVYKIARDGNARMTFLKVTGGSLRVRDEVSYVGESGALKREKIAQIRLCSGEKYLQTDRVSAGQVCAVIGLSDTYAGEGLGMEPDSARPVLEPVLNYTLILPDGCDPRLFYPKLKQLEEEDPTLHLDFCEESGEISARLMGEVQTEVLRRLISERYGISVGIGNGRILYRETIAEPVEGVGHFEPLRHYAEVHLLLRPLPPGSGLVFDTECSEDSLGRNWQRLILGSLGEKVHRGVLTGSPLTDVRITLIAGRAHLKHTDGGDFREAVSRAVRQGLMSGKSVLLEPCYRYRLEVPPTSVGRAMHDMELRHASCTLESSDGEKSLLKGRIPVSELLDYAKEIASYTRGTGRISCVFDGYAPCHNAEEVIRDRAYSPYDDLADSPDSVFCSHGAGVIVPWNQVRERMDLDSGYSLHAESAETLLPSPRTVAKTYQIDDEELEKIMLREFGPIRRRQYREPERVVSGGKSKPIPKKGEYLILDGYNLIFGWEFLKEIAGTSLEKARETLLDILTNYVSYTKTGVTVVFDGYRVRGNSGTEYERDGYRVVYTAENETGDAYIERMMHRLGPDYHIRVVTSDRLIQFSAVHAGILRMSTREFEAEIARINAEITSYIRKLSEQKG